MDDAFVSQMQNCGAKPQFDKIVRNDFGQPKAGPEGARAGIARAISPE